MKSVKVPGRLFKQGRVRNRLRALRAGTCELALCCLARLIESTQDLGDANCPNQANKRFDAPIFPLVPLRLSDMMCADITTRTAGASLA